MVRWLIAAASFIGHTDSDFGQLVGNKQHPTADCKCEDPCDERWPYTEFACLQIGEKFSGITRLRVICDNQASTPQLLEKRCFTELHPVDMTI